MYSGLQSQEPNNSRDGAAEDLSAASLPAGSGPAGQISPAQDDSRWLADQTDICRRYLSASGLLDYAKLRLSAIGSFEPIVMPATQFRMETGPAAPQVSLAGSDGTWKVLYPEPQDLGAEPSSITGVTIRQDGQYAALGVSVGGSDAEQWRICDLSARGSFPERLDGIRYARPEWDPSGALVYARYDGASQDRLAPLGAQSLFRHVPAQAQASDDLIYRGSLVSSRIEHHYCSGRLVILEREGCGPRVDLLVEEPATGSFSAVDLRGVSGLSYAGQEADRIYLTGDDAGLMRGLYAFEPSSGLFQELSLPPAAPGRVLHSAQRLAGGFLLTYLERMAHKAVFFGSDAREIPLPVEGTIHAVGQDGQALLISHSSYATPPRLYRYEIQSAALSEISRASLDVDPQQYVTRVVLCKADDGVEVPISLFYRHGTDPAAPKPALLSAYGGFGEPITRGFSASRLLWADLGGVYAEVGVRGGGDLGESWHRSGAGAEKARAVKDLIQAAEHLTAIGVAETGRLAVTGYSTGGLLAASALLSRPDLFRTGVIHSGLLDIANYPMYTSGPAWRDEFGDPADPPVRAALQEYAPLSILAKGGAAPPALLTTGLGDDKVPPLHTLALAKALQATSSGPVLVLGQPGVGHRIEVSSFPPTGCSQDAAIERKAAEIAFLMDQLGLEEIPETH